MRPAPRARARRRRDPLTRPPPRRGAQQEDFDAMLATDQLRREMREQRSFGGFVEPPICFAPAN